MKLALKIISVIACLAIVGCSAVQPKDGKNWAGYTEVGNASFYADKHQREKTASGELYDHKAKTAAHRKLPFGSRLKVTNIKNGKSVVVRVNDRGPFSAKRVIDLSRSAFSRIGDTSAGVIRVRIEVIE